MLEIVISVCLQKLCQGFRGIPLYVFSKSSCLGLTLHITSDEGGNFLLLFFKEVLIVPASFIIA